MLYKRFLGKIIKADNGCWNWQAGKDRDGYGYFYHNKNRGGRAHRFSWEYHNSKIPKGTSVLHKCNNPACVNPSHLYLGTQQDNMKDRYKAGNYDCISGENNHLAKLTKKDVVDIRKSNITVKGLAYLYEVTDVTIYNILNRKSWINI
jgi:hypothetical protein